MNELVSRGHMAALYGRGQWCASKRHKVRTIREGLANLISVASLGGSQQPRIRPKFYLRCLFLLRDWRTAWISTVQVALESDERAAGVSAGAEAHICMRYARAALRGGATRSSAIYFVPAGQHFLQMCGWFTSIHTKTNTQGSDTHTRGSEQSDRRTVLLVTHQQARRSRVLLARHGRIRTQYTTSYMYSYLLDPPGREA